jgi:hypothetical protein
MSGSPMMVKVRGDWLCAGMAYLGGEGSAISRFVSSPTLLDFAQDPALKGLAAVGGDERFGSV